MCVNPSLYENVSHTALEALACEVPVIATCVGGLPEVVLEGETGYLVEVGDTQAMADRAADILSNTDKQRTMGQRGRSYAIERFNTERVIPQYVELYERVIDEARQRA